MIALNRKIFFKTKKRKSVNKKNKVLYRHSFKFLSIGILLLLFHLFEKKKKYKKKSNMNFCCFVGIAKLENLYARDLVEHYLSIGFEKFYLADDNSIGSEKLSDVLHDYMKKGIVEILDIRGKNWSQEYYYEYAFNLGKKDCKWMSFFDFDEYLEFNNKSMTIKSYLSMKEFNKCDVVKIHWLMFYDNDLVHYDNRPLKERFTKPAYNSDENRYHKSIVRAKNYSGIIWSSYTGPHQPMEELVNMCDAEGNFENIYHGALGSPKFKYCHLNHYSKKTIEECIVKIKRGLFQGYQYNYTERLQYFFRYNKYTLEKAKVVEKYLNITPEQLEDIIKQ